MAWPRATPAISAELRPGQGAGHFTSQEPWSCNPSPHGGMFTETADHPCAETAAKAWGVGVVRLSQAHLALRT